MDAVVLGHVDYASTYAAMRVHRQRNAKHPRRAVAVRARACVTRAWPGAPTTCWRGRYPRAQYRPWRQVTYHGRDRWWRTLAGPQTRWLLRQRIRLSAGRGGDPHAGAPGCDGAPRDGAPGIYVRLDDPRRTHWLPRLAGDAANQNTPFDTLKAQGVEVGQNRRPGREGQPPLHLPRSGAERGHGFTLHRAHTPFAMVTRVCARWIFLQSACPSYWREGRRIAGPPILLTY